MKLKPQLVVNLKWFYVSLQIEVYAKEIIVIYIEHFNFLQGKCLVESACSKKAT